MAIKSFWDCFKEKFGKILIEQHVVNGNEIYITLEQENAKAVCVHLAEDAAFPLVTCFANEEESIETGKNCIYYVFADRQSGFFIILRTFLKPGTKEFVSIADKVHSALFYEREIKDLYGLEPIGHPGAKPMVFHGNWPGGNFPLKRNFGVNNKPEFANRESKFQTVKGEGVFEIPVGPVHAGIIEPGHFRFGVAGEYIINLEAQLYFVHKGIEKLSEGMSLERCFYLSERISGDETFSNSLAFCQAVERIAGVELSERAMFTRVLFVELERLTGHLGDLAGCCLDVAFGFAMSQFRMMRGWSYLLADELCGMRFLRSVNKIGGVRKDFVAGKEKRVLDFLGRIKAELTDTANILKTNGLFLDRVEGTGILKNQIARDLNATGPAGRASAVHYDVRKAFPYAAYKSIDFSVPEHHNGDVNCRINVKIEEAFQSIEILKRCVENMWDGKLCVDVGTLPAFKSALGYTESARGENIHWLMTGENNTVFRYKVRTPSFCNWPALCYAVAGNIVPDFPLINKSFNLSYAGNDL